MSKTSCSTFEKHGKNMFIYKLSKSELERSYVDAEKPFVQWKAG